MQGWRAPGDVVAFRDGTGRRSVRAEQHRLSALSSAEPLRGGQARMQGSALLRSCLERLARGGCSAGNRTASSCSAALQFGSGAGGTGISGALGEKWSLA